jgi:hypothetical protein
VVSAVATAPGDPLAGSFWTGFLGRTHWSRRCGPVEQALVFRRRTPATRASGVAVSWGVGDADGESGALAADRPANGADREPRARLAPS